jgi:hypothetical protein
METEWILHLALILVLSLRIHALDHSDWSLLAILQKLPPFWLTQDTMGAAANPARIGFLKGQAFSLEKR